MNDDSCLEQARLRLSRPLTDREKAKALAALDRAIALVERLDAGRDLSSVPDSVELLYEAREERTRQLMEGVES
jgi:hypothetical protein